MRRPVQIALGVLFLGTLGAVVWVMMPPREPVYEGKPLSSWLAPQDIRTPSVAWEAQERKRKEAVLQIGSNAVPTLLRIFQTKDSPVKVKLFKALLKIRYTPDYEWRRRALYGFALLGPTAESGVPALIDLAERDHSRRWDVLQVLGYIGPGASQAVPSLLQWATNGQPWLRGKTLFTLGKVRADPQLVVPLLTNALHDPSPDVPVYALIALEQFGADAKLAVPTLVDYLKTDPTTRSRDALKAIDPEAAARAGIK